MGTRADFYVGRGEAAEWLGSIAWDGYPAGVYESVFTADSEDDYRAAVSAYLRENDGTTPEAGWPWPWDDSRTTDYAYAFEAGVVYGSGFGHEWFIVDLDKTSGGEPEDDNPAKVSFPNMAERRNMPALGSNRSGVIAIGGER